jgi:hypothetical protein
VGAVEDDAGGGLLRAPSASLDEAQRRQADGHLVILLLTIAGRSTALLGQRASVVPATGARAFEFLPRFSNPVTKFYSHT